MEQGSQPKNIFKCCVLAIFINLTIGCKLLHGAPSAHLVRAEELSRQKLFDEAIVEYRNHMNERLRVKDRPEWENPYFYLILIGDIQLGQDQPGDAQATYDEAEKKGVDDALVSDRYRSLALWYEQHGNLQKAASTLTARRSHDPIIFDSILDRVSKAIVAQEEHQTNK